ncbi:hypothetical protein PENTCL1PPCAC_28674, partial [Pristionchus entomophagus]
YEDGNRLHTMIECGSIFSETIMNAYAKAANLKRKQEQGVQERPGVGKDWSLVDLFISIENTKTFEFFQFISKEHKKALILHVSIMCTHLTQAFDSCENNNEVTIFPNGSRLSSVCPMPVDLEMREIHGVIQMLRDLDIDRKEYVLLKALIVCNP